MSISTLKSCCFNTASGTDCMQSAVAFEDKIDLSIVSIPQAVRIACNVRKDYNARIDAMFQYRKRYGLHAIASDVAVIALNAVSIPQAVRMACNTVSRSPWKQ